MENIDYEKRISDLSQWAESVRDELRILMGIQLARVVYHYTRLVLTLINN